MQRMIKRDLVLRDEHEELAGTKMHSEMFVVLQPCASRGKPMFFNGITIEGHRTNELVTLLCMGRDYKKAVHPHTAVGWAKAVSEKSSLVENVYILFIINYRLNITTCPDTKISKLEHIIFVCFLSESQVIILMWACVLV